MEKVQLSKPQKKAVKSLLRIGASKKDARMWVLKRVSRRGKVMRR